jgi:RNA polymerase sigma-70 factor, ECF subfamily
MVHDPKQEFSDQEIMQGIVRREAEAFATFYNRHAPMVFGFLLRLLRERTEAEDVLQETFWQIWRQAGAYDSSRGSPVAWLIQIARSRGLDRIRQVQLRTRRDGGPIENLYEQLVTQDGADAKTIEQETQRIVRRAVARLSSEQREEVTLAVFGGLTHQEIAKRLETPLGTVKTRIRLGMRKLQEALQETGLGR